MKTLQALFGEITKSYGLNKLLVYAAKNVHEIYKSSD